MSYILDALRRADAERERGAVPGLHAHVLPQPTPAAAGAPPATVKPWVWAAAGCSLPLLGLLVWQLLDRTAPVPAPASVSAAAPTPLPAPIPTVAPIAAPVAAAPAVAPAASSAASSAAAASAAGLRPRPAARPQARADARPTARPVEPTASAAVAAASAAPRIYAQNELPEDVRRQLPALVVGGSVYSAQPASRVLILNGQVFHEGDTLAPDLALDQIRLKSAVLRYKGYRFTISY